MPGARDVALEYIDPLGVSAAELFGMWKTRPGDPASAEGKPVSFDLTAGSSRMEAPLGGLWRIETDGGPEAEMALAGQSRRMRSVEDSLDSAVLEDGQAARLAEQAQSGATAETDRQQGLFAEFLENAGRQVQHYAWIETTESGVLLAHSTVDWFGHLDTVWKQGVSPGQMILHHRSLELALATRITTVKTALTVVRLMRWVAWLSALSGPSALLVLPGLIWQTVNQVIFPVLNSDLFTRR